MTDAQMDADILEQEINMSEPEDAPPEAVERARRNHKKLPGSSRRRAPRGARAPRAPRSAPASSSSSAGAKRGATAEQVQALHETVVAGFMMLGMILPEPIRPTADEFSNMTEPLERIALRHMPAGAVNPDLADGVLFVLAFSGYAVRVMRSGGFAPPRRPAPTRANVPPPNNPSMPRSHQQQAADMTRGAAAPPTASDDPLADAFRRTSNLSEAELAAVVGA